jgi:type I restriction enzyme R subunit
LAGEKILRSKKELIEKFIEENLPKIEDIDTIPQEFDRFWSDEEQKAFIKLVEDENLNESKTKQLIENYLFAQREPIRDEVLSLIEGDQPSVLQRKKKGERIMNRIKGFIETFIEGITG